LNEILAVFTDREVV